MNKTYLTQRKEVYLQQCKNLNLTLPSKHKTKLNRYARDPDGCISKSRKSKYYIRPGTRLVKNYKGVNYIVNVLAQDRFEYEMNIYPNLSAIAKLICGMKVSGIDFFGLNNKTNKPLPHLK